MNRTLISWIGKNDLKSLEGGNPGPVLSTLQAETFDDVVLLYNYAKKEVAPFLKHLEPLANIKAYAVSLESPIHFGDIYQVANQHLGRIAENPATQINILLSPGTPAMQAVWILLGKTRYPAVFYQSTIEQGVQQADIPFQIAAEFQPAMAEASGRQLKHIAQAEIPVDAAFDDILTQSARMQELKVQATTMAQFDIPVLIQGESGTGKELFATAIHNASQRASNPIITVNCGAIPAELIDSTLFGHVKGAFTGAVANKRGLFEEADGGTIFLDEFGELPKEAQVRLLRVLQSGEVMPVGATVAKHVDVRVIAATNRNLMEEVAEGSFREDLFYRVAVGVLSLPPLRHRQGDIGYLAEAILGNINQEAAAQPNYKQKKISVKAKNIINNHAWPGNIRELHSTLFRAALWAKGKEITDLDIEAAMFKMPEKAQGVLGRDINNNFNIQSVIDEVAQHYIKRALAESSDNKTKAAELLGLSSYQTLKNWIEKHNVK
jgi:transcriptional regulator with PAS, ATPase and Fis domain